MCPRSFKQIEGSPIYRIGEQAISAADRDRVGFILSGRRQVYILCRHCGSRFAVHTSDRGVFCQRVTSVGVVPPSQSCDDCLLQPKVVSKLVLSLFKERSIFDDENLEDELMFKGSPNEPFVGSYQEKGSFANEESLFI